MAEEQRRLAAILVADVAGYSKLVGSDEAGTVARLKALLANVIEPAIGKHSGRLFKAVGDGFLVEFASAVQAVTAARAIQDANAEGELPLRIGIHVGDVIVQGDDLMGDGVNVAARIEGMAEAGGIAISRQVRDQVRDKLDVELFDKGEVELKNISRPVRIFTIGSVKPEAPALALPDKPSIAVLPFQNMSGDPEQEYFADGIAEDIITALSRFKSLFVIARNSSFAYKGKSPDIRQVGRDLGVRYVLEGSVRKAGGHVRITGQLIEAASGTHLWADRFEGSLQNVFDLQDRVTEGVVGMIAPTVDRAEIDRLRRKPVASLHTHDRVRRADALIRNRSRSGLEQAMRDLREVIGLDPDYAGGVARLAAACWIFVAQGYGHRDHPLVADMVELARRALALDPTDSEVVVVASLVIGLAGGDLPVGIDLAENAMALNTNNADAYRNGALLHGYLGEIDKTLAYTERASRLNPLYSRADGTGTVVASFCVGNHEAVIDWTGRILREFPHGAPALRYRAASLALLGRMEEARQTVARLLEVRPEYSIAEVRRHQEFDLNGAFKRPGVTDALYRGLRLAGLPE